MVILMLLFYIRHGDPIYRPDSLTPLGHRQAEAVAKRLAIYGIDRIFSSTSNRAILTATPTSELVKKEIELLDFCNETYAWQDFSVPDENGVGRWAFQNRQTLKLFRNKDVLQLGDRWYEHPAFANAPFEKGVKRVNGEVDGWLRSLGYTHNREEGVYSVQRPNEERVALFAHQGFGLAFLSSVLDIPYPLFSSHFDMGHTGMTVIEFPNDEDCIPKVLTMANDGHLYREGLLVNSHYPHRF